jgi:hypothetical protein
MGNGDPHEADQARARTPAETVGDERDERLLPLAFVAGVAVGAVVLGIVWMAFAMTGNDASADINDTSGVAGLGSSLKSGGSARPERPSRLERCQRVEAGLRDPLAAARPAMDQWELHIGAMNKLVVGAITLDQATAFWNQTRVGAERRIAAFERGVARFERNHSACPKPGRLGHASHPMRGCAREVTADRAVLGAARTAVATWRRHVRDMDRLRLGTLSPSDAEQMWLAMWQRGVQELRDYRSAARAAQPLDGCFPGVAGSGVPGTGVPGDLGRMPGM